MTFVHLPFSVRSLDVFIASLVFMKGTSHCVFKRNFSKAELLDCAIANLEVIGAMFLVTSRLGHVGLFISVVGKNTTWLDVSY